GSRFRPARELGVLGHSFGARAALLVAMTEPRVAALVSLDGGIGSRNGAESLRRAASFVPTAKVPPILHLYEENDAFMRPDFTLLESLSVRKLIKERFSDQHHVHFTTFGFAAALYSDLAAATHG